MGALPKLEVFSQEAANFVEQMRKSASQFVHPASASVAPVSAPARDLIDAVDTMLNDLKGQLNMCYHLQSKTNRALSIPLSSQFPLNSLTDLFLHIHSHTQIRKVY
jgi:predicted GNAT family acetyltransferase